MGNFVFDRRVTVPSGSPAGGVGLCSECGAQFDEFVPNVVCTVCVCLVLVCPTCRKGVSGEGFSVPRQEWYCEEHSRLRGAFLHCLSIFNATDLREQLTRLEQAHQGLVATQCGDYRQRISTLARQI